MKKIVFFVLVVFFQFLFFSFSFSQEKSKIKAVKKVSKIPFVLKKLDPNGLRNCFERGMQASKGGKSNKKNIFKNTDDFCKYPIDAACHNHDSKAKKVYQDWKALKDNLKSELRMKFLNQHPDIKKKLLACSKKFPKNLQPSLATLVAPDALNRLLQKNIPRLLEIIRLRKKAKKFLEDFFKRVVADKVGENIGIFEFKKVLETLEKEIKNKDLLKEFGVLKVIGGKKVIYDVWQQALYIRRFKSSERKKVYVGIKKLFKKLSNYKKPENKASVTQGEKEKIKKFINKEMYRIADKTLFGKMNLKFEPYAIFKKLRENIKKKKELSKIFWKLSKFDRWVLLRNWKRSFFESYVRTAVSDLPFNADALRSAFFAVFEKTFQSGKAFAESEAKKPLWKHFDLFNSSFVLRGDHLRFSREELFRECGLPYSIEKDIKLSAKKIWLAKDLLKRDKQLEKTFENIKKQVGEEAFSFLKKINGSVGDFDKNQIKDVLNGTYFFSFTEVFSGNIKQKHKKVIAKNTAEGFLSLFGTKKLKMSLEGLRRGYRFLCGPLFDSVNGMNIGKTGGDRHLTVVCPRFLFLSKFYRINVLAHELGHSLFSIFASKGEAFQKCLSKQYPWLFKKLSKKLKSARFNEIIADYFAQKILNKEMKKNNIKKKSSKRKKDFIKMLSFYCASAGVRHTSKDPHPPGEFRILQYRLHPEISKLFGCKESPVVFGKEQSCRCTLKGKRVSVTNGKPCP